MQCNRKKSATTARENVKLIHCEVNLSLSPSLYHRRRRGTFASSCSFSFGIIKSWKTFFYHHFLVLLARISHYKASECEMKRFFLLGVVIYVLTQLLPFIYVYAEIIWRRDLCYYFDKKETSSQANKNKKKTKSFLFCKLDEKNLAYSSHWA